MLLVHSFASASWNVGFLSRQSREPVPDEFRRVTARAEKESPGDGDAEQRSVAVKDTGIA
jgi:hypothetical protein